MVHPVPGIRLSAASAGIYDPPRPDVALIECVEGSTVAAVFTKNRFSAAPVQLSKLHLADAMPRYFLINAGNANAGTGEAGLADAELCCEFVARETGVNSHEVLPFSTGVIGQRLPVDRFDKAMPELVGALAEDGWEDAARAILTTDLVSKISSRQIQLHGETITISGICKGSGMIRPNMATMLAFIATDVKMDRDLLQASLQSAADVSLNKVTVDGDTSTNDSCVLMATGESGVSVAQAGDLGAFDQALREVMIELAQAIARDGEGATKFITVDVSGADSAPDAEAVAYTVAESPLVKTACFASDPNWGRILAAVGRAPVSGLDIAAVSIWLNDVQVIAAGEPAPDYTEEAGAKAMSATDIDIRIRLGDGPGATRVWTCDYSYDYIRINAEYRS